MNLILTIKNKDKSTVTMKATDLTAEMERMVVEKILNNVDVETRDFNDLLPSKVEIAPFETRTKSTKSDLVEPVTAKKVNKLPEHENTPEFWKTGIKYDEMGFPRYQTYYKCECGDKGKRYVYRESIDLSCRNCGQFINIEPATKKIDEDGLPYRDSFGNFFLAEN